MPAVCEYMTSSAKPEVHNILHRCQRRIKAHRQQAHKIGEVCTLGYWDLWAKRHFDRNTAQCTCWASKDRKYECIFVNFSNLYWSLVWLKFSKLLYCSRNTKCSCKHERHINTIFWYIGDERTFHLTVGLVGNHIEVDARLMCAAVDGGISFMWGWVFEWRHWQVVWLHDFTPCL